jgi:hypothetical protein
VPIDFLKASSWNASKPCEPCKGEGTVHLRLFNEMVERADNGYNGGTFSQVAWLAWHEIASRVRGRSLFRRAPPKSGHSMTSSNPKALNSTNKEYKGFQKMSSFSQEKRLPAKVN